MPTFQEQLELDHDSMVNIDEFATLVVNARTNESFAAIKNNTFISISDEGVPLTKDTPILNLPLKIDIKQNDTLLLEGKNYIVFEVQQDGINGQDVYLKYA